MQRFSSERGRTFLLRLEPGDGLVPSLRRLATDEAVGTAWVRGHGVLENAEIHPWDAEEAERGEAALIGPCELLALEGSLALDTDARPSLALRVTLRRSADGTIVGGWLDAARARGVELLVTSFDDLTLRRDADALALFGGERAKRAVRAEESGAGRDVARVESKEPAAPVSWAMVAAASAEASKPDPIAMEVEQARAREERLRASRRAMLREREDAEFEQAEARRRAKEATSFSRAVEWAIENPMPLGQKAARKRTRPKKTKVSAETRAKLDLPTPELPGRKSKPVVDFDEAILEVGDLVKHRQFGVCTVKKLEDGGGALFELPDGRRRRVRLQVFRIEDPIELPDGRMAYPLAPRGRA